MRRKVLDATLHVSNLQAYLAEKSCWGEVWARVSLERDEYLPVYAAPFEPMDDDDPCHIAARTAGPKAWRA